MPRDEGIKEMEDLQRGAYKGRKMLVRFFCLGTPNSIFAIPCLQITDSAYVCHSEDLLYRRGYEEFKRQSAANPDFEFFKYRHATGEVDERMTSKDYEKNRVYMDYTQNTTLSVNTQYAGNTVGLKKLSLRLGHPQGRQRRGLAGRAHVHHAQQRPERPQDLPGRRIPERLRQDGHGHDPGREHRG